MANLDFYALGGDLRDLVRFLFSDTDIVIFEMSSQFDCEARQFRSLADLESAFQLGAYRAGELQLWSPSVMARPVFRRITLAGVPGHAFRFAVEGAGLMQLYLSGIQEGVLFHSHFGHWNEAGARQRSMHPAGDCDWQALRKLSARIQRHIRNRLSSARLGSRPVLRECFAAVQQGAGLWLGPDVHHAGSKMIVACPPLEINDHCLR